ncbi:MAG: glucan 1,4-alpha-maltotetraohydrolase domain-containing protein [Pseudomonas sp.]
MRNQAYAYILSSPGTPTVYWPEMYDWQRADLIRSLIKLRRQAGIKADSPITFLGNYSGLVAQTTGTEQSLLIALNSDMANPVQGKGEL